MKKIIDRKNAMIAIDNEARDEAVFVLNWSSSLKLVSSTYKLVSMNNLIYNVHENIYQILLIHFLHFVVFVLFFDSL